MNINTVRNIMTPMGEDHLLMEGRSVPVLAMRDEHRSTDIKVMSWNVGLLRLRLFGQIVFSNPPHAEERLPFIPGAILAENPDILLIQECYEAQHCEYLAEALRTQLPHSVKIRSGGIRFDSGLMIVSRWPISESRLVRCERVSLLEQLAATKSHLIATINPPFGAPITVINLHTTAGGESDPEHERTISDRESEINQALNDAQQAVAEGNRVILGGDLNAGPEAAIANYEMILDGGWQDAYLVGGGLATSYTWDPDNQLNRIGPHSSCPGQRCDHIFIRPEDQWAPDMSSVQCTGTQQITIGLSSTLSDHHAVVTYLRDTGRK